MHGITRSLETATRVCSCWNDEVAVLCIIHSRFVVTLSWYSIVFVEALQLCVQWLA